MKSSVENSSFDSIQNESMFTKLFNFFQNIFREKFNFQVYSHFYVYLLFYSSIILRLNERPIPRVVQTLDIIASNDLTCAYILTELSIGDLFQVLQLRNPQAYKV
jgi:hypothetical protein